ncbi:MAG: efflux RND transporter periplasmic adaptor subunit [Planctomycetaceae bacterium]
MTIKKLARPAAAMSAIGLSAWAVYSYFPRPEPDTLVPEEPNVSTTAAVRFSDNKKSIAHIRTEPCRTARLQKSRRLPAHFAYDDTRHVAIRAATDGLLQSVDVKPGDRVTAGQIIAVLRSPAIASARSEVLNRQAELELATKQSDWQASICNGVDGLAAAIQKGEPVSEIEQRVNKRTLGDYRSRLLNAYSKARAAARAAESATSVSGTGAISGRTVRQRQSESEQAKATLEAALEQSVFDTHQACQQANSVTQAAKRSLQVARQRLATLMGTSVGDKALNIPTAEADLAKIAIRSPIAGTVERKVYSATERVSEAAEMFIIADTSQLWVRAEVRGRDWSATSLKEGDSVLVETAIRQGEPVNATIHYVGREVDQSSGAVPLVARIDNATGEFRPGLFARMSVRDGKAVESIAVADAAVVDIDGDPNVFVERDGAYYPVVVETGIRSRGLIEIRRGLTEGQHVVVEGAFTLKSELLLEGEE